MSPLREHQSSPHHESKRHTKTPPRQWNQRRDDGKRNRDDVDKIKSLCRLEEGAQGAGKQHKGNGEGQNVEARPSLREAVRGNIEESRNEDWGQCRQDNPSEDTKSKLGDRGRPGDGGQAGALTLAEGLGPR